MRLFFLTLSLFLCTLNYAENTNRRRPVLSGYVYDQSNGEVLIGATIYIKETSLGTTTNVYGFYSISLAPGTYHVHYQYIGYENIEKVLTIKDDVSQNIELSISAEQLKEVTVSGERSNANILKNEMSIEKLNSEDIRKIPALFGEVDLIKAVQLLPGVQTPSEGSSGFSVRGGNLDQNLILLDEANVYNASHLLGFFSVFNNDAVKDLKLYKGDIPSKYGGRLSSVLDIHMREGNNKKWCATGGLGAISSRLTLEGPLWNEKISTMLAARRTYVDLFFPFSSDENVQNSSLYFYDINTKINYRINDNNRVFLSGYFGRDVFGSDHAGMDYGNITATARWNHLFSKKLFSNLSFVYSNYHYNLKSDLDDTNGFLWESGMNDISTRYNFTYFLSPDITINYGLEGLVHIFQPGFARGTGNETSFGAIKVPETTSLEGGIYVGADYQVTPLLSIKAGLRNSSFANYGDNTTYTYDEEGYIVDSAEHNGGIYQTYNNWEPRLGVNLTLNEKTSIKASYARTAQYMQMARNSSAGTPLDVWFSASPNVKPQIGNQLAAGVFRNFLNDHLKGSVEVFYKWMSNTIDFKDYAQLLLNEHLESELQFGKSWAYGAEFMMKYELKKVNGWLSYTYSRTERKIDGINDNNTFLAPYDKPHDVSLVFNYQIIDRLTLGATWVYSTGLPTTFPVAMAKIGNRYVRLYDGRNKQRYPDYHRLDISLTWENRPFKVFGRKVFTDLNASVYNAYDRHNAWAINFYVDENNPDLIYAEKTYILGIVPTISFNFKF